MKHDQAVDGAMQLLEVQAKDWGCSLSPEQVDLLRQYAELLATYDAANVIGSKDMRNIILDHVTDSLSCLSTLGDVQGKLIDVGAGGGLPGIPLAVAQPVLGVTLLEATEKKVRFLNHVTDSLKLSNIKILNCRAEEAGSNKDLRDSYGVAVARALASLPVLLEYCAPLVATEGLIVAMKGRVEKDELEAGRRAAEKVGAEIQEVVRVELRPELEQKQRHLVVFRKVKSTPTGYPRRTGLARKRPLGT